MQLRGIEGVQTELIGRERELKQLQTALETVMREQQSRMITVVGEAGIGKSCLMHQFQNWMDLLPQSIRLLGGRATSDMPGLPFGLMRDALYSRFEIQENDPPNVAREKFENGVHNLWAAGESQSPEADEQPQILAHFIGHLIGFDCSQSTGLKEIIHDPNQIRQRAFYHLGRFFSAISRGTAAGGNSSPCRAALLVAEDIHWADDGSLDLLDYLARSCAKAPLLIVCLARTALFERIPSWG